MSFVSSQMDVFIRDEGSQKLAQGAYQINLETVLKGIYRNVLLPPMRY
jgi:hypothetical protein